MQLRRGAYGGFVTQFLGRRAAWVDAIRSSLSIHTMHPVYRQSVVAV